MSTVVEGVTKLPAGLAKKMSTHSLKIVVVTIVCIALRLHDPLS